MRSASTISCEKRSAIAHPLLLHIAGDDGFVDKATQAVMHEGLDDHPKVTLLDYPGVDHGFATEFGERRDELSATRDARTAAFLASTARGIAVPAGQTPRRLRRGSALHAAGHVRPPGR
jgi:dienelactone hydrolase